MSVTRKTPPAVVSSPWTLRKPTEPGATYALEDPVGRVAGNSVPAQVLSVVLPLSLSTSRRTLQTVLRCPSDASASLTGTGIRLGQVWSAANPAALGTKAPALTSRAVPAWPRPTRSLLFRSSLAVKSETAATLPRSTR